MLKKLTVDLLLHGWQITLAIGANTNHLSKLVTFSFGEGGHPGVLTRNLSLLIVLLEVLAWGSQITIDKERVLERMLHTLKGRMLLADFQVLDIGWNGEGGGAVWGKSWQSFGSSPSFEVDEGQHFSFLKIFSNYY